MKLTAFCFVLALAVAVQAEPAGASTAGERLERLAAQERERSLDLYPVAETMEQGSGPRQDRLELHFTAAHRERQRHHFRWLLSELEKVPPERLTPTERITLELLENRARSNLERLRHPLHQHYIFIQLNGGVANDLVHLVGRQPFRNEADYHAWLRRLGRYPEFLDAVAAAMREGMAAGITIPKPVVERALVQLDSLAPADHATSTLWRPVKQYPSSMDEAARAGFEARYRTLLVEEVFPAIRRLSRFVREDYLPKARTTFGVGALPGGAEMYRYLIQAQTTTTLSADEIHALGLKEVARVQAELLKAGEKAGFKGPIRELRAWLAANPDNFPFKTGEEVVQYLKGIHATIVPKMPSLFGRVPKAAFDIRLTDPAIAASAPAQYYPPSDDGTRPGIFAIPVVNPARRSSFGLVSLLAHEGMPGHHFDVGLKLESKVPEFRRRLWVNAFGEGWGLYAEYLGHELGLYEKPIDLMGRYADELYRSCRLVVDTGIHAKDWTRDQAIRYLLEECGVSEVGAANETDRYMAWPAQALGYKIGEIAIREIRARAQSRLGKRFDIRAFHDALLEEGHMPLDMLRARMDRWIEQGAAGR